MGVTRSCKDDADLIATKLLISDGEYLEYEISFQGAQAHFAVNDQHGTVVLSSKDGPVAPGRYAKKWPLGSIHVPDDLNHVLGIHFIAATQYSYRVTRYDRTGATITTCKDCTFSSTDSTDSFFEPLRIFTF